MFRAPIIQNSLFQGIMGANEFIAYQEALTIEERKDIVLISITEPDNENYMSDVPTRTHGFHEVLEVKFWDVEKEIGSYEPLTWEKGSEIRQFIEKNKDKKFLIHCKAGMSRSAGVGKAVECLVNHDGDAYAYSTSKSEIDDYYRYEPNRTVYDRIVKDKE